MVFPCSAGSQPRPVPPSAVLRGGSHSRGLVERCSLGFHDTEGGSSTLQNSPAEGLDISEEDCV